METKLDFLIKDLKSFEQRDTLSTDVKQGLKIAIEQAERYNTGNLSHYGVDKLPENAKK